MNQMLACVLFIHAAVAIVVTHPESSGRGSAYEVQKAQETAHQKALGISGVCAVIVDDPGQDDLGIGSGIYIYGENGVGYVLTAAHGLAREQMRFVQLSFQPDYRVGEKIQVSWIHIHPQFNASARASDYDIAIIEFHLSDLGRDIAPVPFDASTYEGESFIESTVVGYGSFGTNASPLLDMSQVHAGSTWVQVELREGESPSFMSRIPHKANRFSVQATLSQYFDTQLPEYPNMTVSILGIKIHPEQSMFLSGDTGGPLFFNSRTGGLKLAGIARSLSLNGPLTLPGGKDLYFMANRWEPIFLHKVWIYGVLSSSGGRR